MSHKGYILGSGIPTLDDAIARVVIGGAQVVLDQTAADRIKKESPSPKSFESEPYPERGDSDEHDACACLDEAQTRAAIFFKLSSLVNGKSTCRLAVLEFLTSLLNARISPRLSATDNDASALSQLADAIHGRGKALSTLETGGTDLSEVLKRSSIPAPGLSIAERSVLLDGQAASAGTGALCVEASKTLLSMATCVAALSGETMKANVRSFDMGVVEALPHKGSADVADTIRTLLEGSGMVNAKKGGCGSLQALNDVVVVHAAAQQDINAAAVTVKAVLASAAFPPSRDGSLQQASSPALPSSLMALAASLLRCTALSLRRTGAIIEYVGILNIINAISEDGEQERSRSALQAGLRSISSSPCMTFEAAQQQIASAMGKTTLADECPASLAASLAAYSAVHALTEAIGIEALVCLLTLRFMEGPMVAEADEASADQENSKDDTSKSKDAKNKKKSKKKSGNGMALGKGTSVLRSSLESAVARTMYSCVEADGNSNALSVVNGGTTGQKTFLRLDLQSEDRSIFAGWLRTVVSAIMSQFDALNPAVSQHLARMASVLEANAARRKPKVAKGARDFAPDQMAIRDIAFAKIVAVFKRHGAVSIDTPVFELRETLTGKYGEDSKLIYDLADQGGELLSLRYDLTVPFARYVALHGITNIKRYHIAKVYRRDQPQMTRGRFREFFQCDFDIAGSYAPMVADAEVVKVLVEILKELDLGEFEVKLNHRQLLDAMLDIAGVPPQKFRTICSAIDKLDKEPWEVVKAEMTEEKGLSNEVADKIGEFVVLRGAPMELLEKLSLSDHAFAEHSASKAALDELRQLFSFLKEMDALGPIIFDLSLARGLDYYTGVIYEAVLKGGKVGSIAAGGRYDHLVGMFSGKEVPAVGVSIGIERVFAIMEAKMREEATKAGGSIRETETECLIASIGSGHQSRRMAMASQLWAAGIKTEFGYKPNPKMGDQLSYALKSGIPFMVLFGEDEIAQGIVKLKDLDAGTEETVSAGDLPQVLALKIANIGERRIVSQQPQEKR